MEIEGVDRAAGQPVTDHLRPYGDVILARGHVTDHGAGMAAAPEQEGVGTDTTKQAVLPGAGVKLVIG